MPLTRYLSSALSPGGTPGRFLHWLSALLAIQTLSSVVPGLAEEPTLIRGWVLILASSVLIAAVFLTKSETVRLWLIKAFHLYGMGLCMAVIFFKMGPDSCMMWLLTWTLSLVIAERREYLSSAWVVLIMTYCMMLIGSRFVWNSLTIGNPWPPLLTGIFGCVMNTYLLKVDVAGMDNYYREMRLLLAQLEELSKRMTAILTESGELSHQLWRVSEECIPLLGLEDCVIYLYDEKCGMLVQTAAYGDKSGGEGRIVNPIHIKPGEGVVGRCFSEAREMDIPDTMMFPGYIVDDAARNSELAVPILSNGKPVGVLDSEHSVRGFYKDRHKQAFRIIASFCGVKITESYARKSIEAAESVRLEAEHLREVDELKNRFITNISHDLKTPLSLIKAPARQLAEEAKDTNTRNLAGYILKNAEHLLKVMNQLLQLNRLDKGLNQLYIKESELQPMLTEVAGRYEGMVADKKIDFRWKAEALRIKTDEFRLEQIIHNLLQNAFRYTPPGGSVRMEALRHGDFLRIEVADTGPGIPDHLRDKIFERFYKLDPNNHEGTGIGLSLVREYAAALSGRAEVEPNQGGGARFIVHVPLVTPDAESTPNPAEAQTTDRPFEESDMPVMLVAEDHPDLNNFICQAFEGEFRCIQAFDGREALARIAQTLPDIIITDLMMPAMDGEALIKHLREDDTTAHLPILVLTAVSGLQSKVELYGLGIENYLTKPFEVDELKAVVDGLLKQRKRLRELFGHKYFQTNHPESPAQETNPTEESPLVREALKWVLEHLEQETLSINDLSAALGMGRNRLQREIKAATGLTPVEFVRSVRLNEARKMLSGGNCHVSEAAYACGFNNLSYFSRSFKSEFGHLPSDIATLQSKQTSE